MENAKKAGIGMNQARRHTLWTKFGRTGSLLMAMVAGFSLPQAQWLAPALQYLIMCMLFLAFLDLSVDRTCFDRSLIFVIAANLLLPFFWFVAVRQVQPDLALVAFLTAATPTATATPVIVGFLRGRVEYAIAGVLATNILMAILLPFALPIVAGGQVAVSTSDLLPPVLATMFIPLALAWIVRLLPARVGHIARKAKPASFPIWLLVLFVITSKASAFLWQHSEISSFVLLEIAGLSLIICATNFLFGAWLGGARSHREASQTLGQKNTSFTIWIALTFLTPLTALGPTFYVAYHNLYNAYQLMTMKEND
jgi:bile acid:Na+ symporter, BASS family